MATPLRAVFLDAGDTLFTGRRSRNAWYASVAAELGGDGDPEDATRALECALGEIPITVEGSYRYTLGWFAHFNAAVLARLGVAEKDLPRGHERLVQIFDDPESYVLYPEVPGLLRELNESEVTVGVISNWSEHLPALLEGLGIAPILDFLVISAEVRAEKPEREIFERALFRAGVAAEEALHVGNDLKMDVHGALGAGLRAAWLDREDLGHPAPDGVAVIRELRGLLSVIEQGDYASRS